MASPGETLTAAAAVLQQQQQQQHSSSSSSTTAAAADAAAVRLCDVFSCGDFDSTAAAAANGTAAAVANATAEAAAKAAAATAAAAALWVQRQSEEEDSSLLLRRVSQGIRDLTGALVAAQEQLQRAAEGRQELLLEKQRLEARLEEANGALREAQAERLRLKEAEGQRNALRIQAEVQQQSLEQQALLIDGLKQRCITLEAEKRELSCARSTTTEGSGSSFRSLFFSWGPQEGPRQRRGLEEGDVLSYTLADGLEEGLRQPSPRRVAATPAAGMAAAGAVVSSSES
ncbi:hypothetical protein Esti_004424 [Eimeria stiedai]